MVNLAKLLCEIIIKTYLLFLIIYLFGYLGFGVLPATVDFFLKHKDKNTEKLFFLEVTFYSLSEAM